MLSVNTNTAALNAYRNLSISNDAANQSMQRLSSGYRINSAADDAAGLAISTGMGSQISGMNQAVRNTQDGISVIQTASGALNEATSILQRMRDLAVQAANDSNDSNSRSDIATEVGQLQKELTRIGSSTKFNGISLLDGTAGASGTMTFQVGADAASGTNAIQVDLSGANLSSIASGATGLDVSASGAFSSASAAASAISTIDTVIQSVSTAQAKLGAYQNRFQHTINNLNTAVQNTTASQSRIRDTDMAQEMTNFSKSQILVQAGTSMLAQANSSTQSILKLLQG